MQTNQAFTYDPAVEAAGRVYRGTEHGDLPVDDPPPKDYPSERYSAWSATSIFNFVPFSAPGGR